MSRRRKTKAKKPERPEPEDVLEGRVEVRPEDLFDLIHQVNPTGLALAKKEVARRYALKNRLQSLLIRRYGDERLTVERTVHPNVVSLEHLAGTRNACHAIVAALEPDARSWVRRQLDVAGGEEEAEAPVPGLAAASETRSADEVEDLLLRGRQAIAEFDYELGEELLGRAFTMSRGAVAGEKAAQSVAAAQALLELQVDCLGMDAAALALEPQLSPAARKQPGIRTLLALAAARLGKTEAALGWVAELTPAVAGVSLPRAAEVFVALTAKAIGQRARAPARSYLRRVTEYDPAHPRIPLLEAEIARLRAEDQRGVEAELERRFGELGAAAVEDEARALADRWPEGEVARRILRQAAAERREAEIAEHLELAEKARGAGRLEDAARHFRAALDAGSLRDDLPALVTELEDLARRQRERAEVDAVAGRFAPPGEGEEVAGQGDPERREAFLAYLSLADGSRTRVHEQVAQPALGWLDEVGAARVGTKLQAATAILALEKASAAFASGDAPAAADGLEPHRAILRHVERARILFQAVRRQLAAERQERAHETLEAALAAFEKGRTAASRRLLEGTPRGNFRQADLASVEKLAARLDKAEQIEELERQQEGHVQAGDLTAALRIAGRLVEQTREGPPAAQRRWRQSFADLEQRIATDWSLEVVEEAVPIELALQPSHWRESSAMWLDDTGREIVLASAWSRWLFIDAVDLESRQVTSRVSLRTPRPIVPPLLTRRDGGSLWITGYGGDLLEIAREGWKIRGFYPLGELLPGERTVERAVLVPGSSWVWMQVTGMWEGDEICVVDLEQWRVARQRPAYPRFMPILGPGEPRMLVSGSRFAPRLYTAGGELAGPERLVHGSVVDAAVGPDGRGLLALVSNPKDDEGEAGEGIQEDRLTLVRLLEPPEGGDLRPVARLELTSAHPHFGFHAVVTALDRGQSFVSIYTRDNDHELMVFSGEQAAASTGRLEPVARSRWPGRSSLVQDLRARHLAVYESQTGLFALYDLDSPPPPAGGPLKRSLEFPRYQVYANGCGRPTGALETAILELASELEARGTAPLRTHLAQVEEAENLSVDEKLRVALALQRSKKSRELGDAIEGFARRLARKHRRHAGVHLLLAELAAHSENWDAVDQLLRRVSAAGLDPGRGRHFRHLEGLAHLHGGRLSKAHKAFCRGAKHDEGDCDLEALMQLTLPMADPPKAEEWSLDQPKIRRLVGAIRCADRALAEGDPHAARDALDRYDMRWQQEVQIAARRAAVALEIPAATAGERFRRRLALAFFIHVWDLEIYLRHNLVLPGLSWDEARLEELAARVRDQLEKM